jgi:hypothetical protein
MFEKIMIGTLFAWTIAATVLIVVFVFALSSSKVNELSPSLPVSADLEEELAFPEIPNEKRQLSKEEKTIVLDELLRILDEEDPRASLQVLTIAVNQNDAILRSCHAIVHDVGHAAYEKYGSFSKTMEYQDDVCNGAYIHGSIEALFAESDDLAIELQTVCDDVDPGNCYHGTGHGFMFYTNNDINNSLDWCEVHKTDSARNECYAGAFMELFTAIPGFEPVELIISDPLATCLAFDSTQQYSCHYYAPTYYLTLHPSDYIGALEWCKESADGYQELCTKGVGAIAIKENIQYPLEVQMICETADPDQVAICIDGMVGLYMNHYFSATAGEDLCLILDDRHLETCEAAVESRRAEFE